MTGSSKYMRDLEGMFGIVQDLVSLFEVMSKYVRDLVSMFGI